jgi:hypothetical protein
MKKLCNSKMKKLSSNLFKKFILLLMVWYVVTCHAIIITDYRFKLSFWIIWGELYVTYHYRMLLLPLDFISEHERDD